MNTIRFYERIPFLSSAGEASMRCNRGPLRTVRNWLLIKATLFCTWVRELQ